MLAYPLNYQLVKYSHLARNKFGKKYTTYIAIACDHKMFTISFQIGQHARNMLFKHIFCFKPYWQKNTRFTCVIVGHCLYDHVANYAVATAASRNRTYTQDTSHRLILLLAKFRLIYFRFFAYWLSRPPEWLCTLTWSLCFYVSMEFPGQSPSCESTKSSLC